jgi:hypothetical protein
MPDTQWTIKGRNFTNCNCAYGCPCQFNARPTHGSCYAVVGIDIDSGHHREIPLDGLRFATAVSWPGAIHEGRGQCVPIIDERATPEQRAALLRIMGGEDTEPGATIFQVFSSTFEKVHEPVFAAIDLDVDIDGRSARLRVPGMIEARGEPILNPVTGNKHRVRIDQPAGFEYDHAEVGRGWFKASGALEQESQDSHAHFAPVHMTQSGVVR